MTTLDLPTSFGDVVHLDVLYGAGTAFGGTKYALYLVDRATRYKSIYPLQNLGENILKQLKQYCNDFNLTPKRFISDYDKRLFSTSVQDWLSENNSQIEAAPEGKQRQNGLCEEYWRTVLRMTQGWTASALLPTSYWWFAFKRAVEVSNYIPLKLNNKMTSPHELVYKIKPDMRNLLPMFSVCYIRRYKSLNNTKLKNIENNSLAVI